MAELSRKNEVKDFYNQVGWQRISAELYQNAIYEDLRPVSREYIERCHLRVNRHIIKNGKYLLDAGSGPVQWPAYLTYSEGYRYRVCMDISLVALQEARSRLDKKGLYIVGDVSNLPFKSGVFGGTVSMHTLHHLSSEDQKRAYAEMYRTLAGKGKMVVVNGWHASSRLMQQWLWLVKIAERLGVKTSLEAKVVKPAGSEASEQKIKKSTTQGALIPVKIPFQWIKTELKDYRSPAFTVAQRERSFPACVDPSLVGR